VAPRHQHTLDAVDPYFDWQSTSLTDIQDIRKTWVFFRYLLNKENIIARSRHMPRLQEKHHLDISVPRFNELLSWI